MDLKNMTMDDLKQKFSSIDKKTLIKFGIGFGAIILFLIIYYVILNPMVKERKAKFQDKIQKEQEIVEYESNIVSLKKTIKKMKPKFEETSTLFHSKAEVEDLYQSLSKHAAVNGLVISKIEKKDPKPVRTTKPVTIQKINSNLFGFLKTIPKIENIKITKPT